MRWFLSGRAERRRQAALAAAAAAQEAEQRAARRRVLEAATQRLPVVRSARPDRPLLTPGQAARSRRAVR